MASVTIIPVCCPLSLQGNESILSQQRAGVDLSIWTKELVQFFVRSIYRKVPYKQLHVLTAHLCKNQASAREQTWRGEHTVICDLSNGNRLARRLVDLNRKFAVLKKSRKAYQSWLIPPPTHTHTIWRYYQAGFFFYSYLRIRRIATWQSPQRRQEVLLAKLIKPLSWAAKMPPD